MAEEAKSKSSYADKILNFVLSDNTKKYVILFFVIGAILRFIIANHVRFLADEMIHGVHAIDILKSGIINLQNQSPAWYYATDIAYRIFGVSAFAGRFLSFLFGSMMIFLIYLIAKEIYNERIALISAFLIAVSGFAIRYTLMEMDLTMIFLILAGFYFFIKGIKDKNEIPYSVPVILGTAILVKPISLPFIASFLVYFLFIGKKNSLEFINKNRKRILVSAVIIFLFCMPVLAFNYIAYTQRGVSDVIFSRFLEINQDVYSSLQGYDQTFSVSDLIHHGLPAVFTISFIPMDTITFILGILGILLIFFVKDYHKGKFFVAFHLVPFIFLIGTSWLQTHLSNFMPLFCLTAAVFIDFVSSKVSDGKHYKKIAVVTCLIIFAANLVYLMPMLSSQDGIINMRDYAAHNMGGNDIVIADARIYGGRIAWIFNDKHYLQATYFEQLLQINNNLTSPKTPVNLYFVECVNDDCGWGTIKDQPEVNASMEGMVKFFHNNSQKIAYINGGGGEMPSEEGVAGKPYLNIYKATLNVSPEVYSLIDNTHSWFFYPVRWQASDWYDKYTPQGLFQNSLQGIGKLFLWLSIIILFLVPIIIILEYLGFDTEKLMNKKT